MMPTNGPPKSSAPENMVMGQDGVGGYGFYGPLLRAEASSMRKHGLAVELPS